MSKLYAPAGYSLFFWQKVIAWVIPWELFRRKWNEIKNGELGHFNYVQGSAVSPFRFFSLPRASHIGNIPGREFPSSSVVPFHRTILTIGSNWSSSSNRDSSGPRADLLRMHTTTVGENGYKDPIVLFQSLISHVHDETHRPYQLFPRGIQVQL